MPRILVCSLLVAAALHQTPASQQPLTFRTGVELVAVDFLVSDRDGRPVADLQTGDVSLKVDGKVRDIRTLQFVPVGGKDAATATAATNALAVPYASNDRDGTGRLVLFVVDEDHIRTANTRIIVDGSRQFLDALGPNDQAAVITLPNVRVAADLTTDHQAIRAALSKLAGRALEKYGEHNLGIIEALAIARSSDPRSHEYTINLADWECHLVRTDPQCVENAKTSIVLQARTMSQTMELATRTLFDSLVDLLSGLSTIEGPKTVVFFSEAIVPSPDTPDRLIDVSRAAGAARSQLYVIQPNVPSIGSAAEGTASTGSTGDLPPTGRSYNDDLQLQLDGLSDLASATGGAIFRLSGTAENVIRRISLETSGFYMLGFSPDVKERDGKSHRIEVKVTRPGLTVRARPEFTIHKAATGAEPRTTPDKIVTDLSSYRDLPLRVGAVAFRGVDAGHVKLIVLTETPEASRTFATIIYSLFDSSGKIAAQWTADAAQLTGPFVTSATAVQTGAYRLRVAASDAGGALGAVNYSLTAGPIPAAPIATSDLMLGVMNASGAFAPKLDFTGADQVTGYFEIYSSQPPPADMTIALELCRTVDGPPIAGTTAALGKTADADRFVARGTIPLSGVAAGDYVVRARVTVSGTVVATVTRTLRK